MILEEEQNEIKDEHVEQNISKPNDESINKTSSAIISSVYNMAMKYFPFDESYVKEVTNCKKIDGYIAILLYVGLLAVYYGMGLLYAKRQIYFGIGVNLLFAFLCFTILIIRRQKFSSVGITLDNMTESVRLGFYPGLGILLISSVIPNIMSGRILVSFEEILYQAIYHFLVIGFVEELLFRGYLQTRIHAFISRETIAVFVTGILFMILHIPFHLASSQLSLFAFLKEKGFWLITTFFLHFVFYALYRRYNSLFAGTIFHGFLNIGSRLFRS